MRDDAADERTSKAPSSHAQDDADSDTHPGVIVRNAFGIAALMWIGITLLIRSCS